MSDNLGYTQPALPEYTEKGQTLNRILEKYGIDSTHVPLT